jgi:hypothetical protein
LAFLYFTLNDLLINYWTNMTNDTIYSIVKRGATVSVVSPYNPNFAISLRGQRLARFFGYPRFMDGMLARPMTSREMLGWVVVAIIVLLAVVFTGKR